MMRRIIASLFCGCVFFASTTGLVQANDPNGECGATPEIPKSASAVSSALLHDSSSSTSLTRKPKSGDIVTFSLLRFRPTHDALDPPLFDTSGTLQLVLDGGNYLVGLHDLLSTMNPGETVEGAKIDAGYAGYHALAGAAYDVDVKLEKVEEGPTIWEYAGGDGAKEGGYEVATFGLGCFWGGELAFQRMPGVVSTQVGYTQGQKENPTYRQVSAGITGHTEATRIIFNPTIVSFSSLVQLGLDRLGKDVYKLNQVGNDRGTQYRHGIYYHNDSQEKVAKELLKGYGNGGRKVMTEVHEAKVFYAAEDYHQQYLLKGGQSAKKGAGETIRCYG